MSENLESPYSNSSTNSSLSHEYTYINEKLIKRISIILEKVLYLNSNKFQKTKSSFNCTFIPNISLYNYIYRIQKYSEMEDNTLILALIYIDRICCNNFIINYYNIHKIILISIVFAIKYNEDNYYTNSYYSKIGGIKINEFNALEKEFVSIIDFQFYVKKSLFDKYYKYINNDSILSNNIIVFSRDDEDLIELNL